MTISDLPTVNAILNTGSATLLAMGYVMIRRRRPIAHRNCMIGAFIVSAVFLTCYLVYHYHAGSKRFTLEGWIRPVYFTILISHILPYPAACAPDALLGMAEAIRQTPSHRSYHVSALDVRVCHGCHYLLDALSASRIGFPRFSESPPARRALPS